MSMQNEIYEINGYGCIAPLSRNIVKHGQENTPKSREASFASFQKDATT